MKTFLTPANPNFEVCQCPVNANARVYVRPLRLMARTSFFRDGDTGSIPVEDVSFIKPFNKGPASRLFELSLVGLTQGLTQGARAV